MPYPVGYKRGVLRQAHVNELQLCAQVMCLEEMLCCEIPEGALYFIETRHRTTVSFFEELHQEMRANLAESHQLYEKHYTTR